MASYTGLYANYPPELSASQLDLAKENLQNYALSVGFAVKPHLVETDDGPRLPEGAIAAPITLFPSLFPESCFNEALAIQKLCNTLYANIARDEAWLEEIVPKLAKLDDFVHQLWSIHLELRDAKAYTQLLALALFRSDYMVHTDTNTAKPQIRQVEFNTIASSFGGLSVRAAQVHRNLIVGGSYVFPDVPEHGKLAASDSAAGLARGLRDGHDAYVESVKPTRATCVVFIVQDNERNVFDQLHIQNHLVDDHGIKVFRVIFQKALESLKIEDDGTLLYPDIATNTSHEVTVVYLRAGYAPTEYTSAQDWSTRKELERSKAIKCPSVMLQLAGMKKVQQVLASPGSQHMERFLPSASEAEVARIRATFAPMFPMDDTEAGRQGQKLALDASSAAHFVLKPQREGGGNNVYRDAIPPFLRARPTSEWDAYILMQMIEPPAQRNTIVRDGQVVTGGVICELGIYGSCVFDGRGGTTPHNNNNKEPAGKNEAVGYLLRTKGDTSTEGGVAAGFGCLDSVLLVPDEALA